MTALVSATHIIGGKPAAIDGEFTSTNTNPPLVERSKKFKHQEKITKKAQDKVDEEKEIKTMKAKKIELEIEKIQLERESSKISPAEEKLLAKLKVEKEISAKEKEKTEIDKIKSKFEIALPKFKDKYTKDGTNYEVPKYSCVVNESDKPILKVLLDERGKRASWLEFIGGKDDRKEENWMSLIKPELKTITQLAKKDENAKILLSLLTQYSSIRVINSQPIAKQSVPAKPAAPAQSTAPQEVSVPPKPPQPTASQPTPPEPTPDKKAVEK